MLQSSCGERDALPLAPAVPALGGCAKEGLQLALACVKMRMKVK